MKGLRNPTSEELKVHSLLCQKLRRLKLFRKVRYDELYEPIGELLDDMRIMLKSEFDNEIKVLEEQILFHSATMKGYNRLPIVR